MSHDWYIYLVLKLLRQSLSYVKTRPGMNPFTFSTPSFFLMHLHSQITFLHSLVLYLFTYSLVFILLQDHTRKFVFVISLLFLYLFTSSVFVQYFITYGIFYCAFISVFTISINPSNYYTPLVLRWSTLRYKCGNNNYCCICNIVTLCSIFKSQGYSTCKIWYSAITILKTDLCNSIVNLPIIYLISFTHNPYLKLQYLTGGNKGFKS